MAMPNYSNYSPHDNNTNAHDFSLKGTHPRLDATVKRSSMLHGEKALHLYKEMLEVGVFLIDSHLYVLFRHVAY